MNTYGRKNDSRLEFLAAFAVLCTGLAAAGQAFSQSDGPEATIRALVRAIYANDVDAYNAVTVPHPRRELLTKGGRRNDAKLKQLQDDPQFLQMRRNRPLLFRGREASLDATGRYPTGTTALYTVAPQGGSPTVVTLVRQDDGWKVDVRWWLAQADLESAAPKPGTPEHAIRQLTVALLRMDRDTAVRLATPGASLDLLFQGGQREPSGHLEALAMEMPLVELRPGEHFPIDGRVVEGSTRPDNKLFLGHFGTVEIPFVVRRSGSDWRVEPQAFFRYFNR